MKRILAMLLAAVMMVSLAACESETTSSSSDAAPVSSAPVSSQVEESSANVSSEESEESEESIPEEPEDQIVFEELVVVDNEECTIKITGIESDNTWGYTLKAELENKSAEKVYMFSIESAAINGVQCDPFFASEVAAGKKANEEISFSDEKNNIGDFTDIELTFRVYDSNDWSADDVANETVHVYPYGEEKAVAFVREAQTSDNVVIDNEYVTVTVTGYEQDNIRGYGVNLFLVNKTDKTVMFSVDDASVNGYMADPFYADSVIAGKCAFSTVYWSDSTLEENGITEIEEIEILLRAHDADDYSADDFANEVITLNP